MTTQKPTLISGAKNVLTHAVLGLGTRGPLQDLVDLCRGRESGVGRHSAAPQVRGPTDTGCWEGPGLESPAG